jgi:two-component system nitrogen regulation sensor histidine kinase GlnL
MKSKQTKLTDELGHFLLDQLSGAVVLLDAELRPLYLNPAAEGMLAVSRQHAAGHSLSELIRDGEVLIAALRETLASGTPFTQRQANLNLATLSQPVCVDVSATPLPGDRILLEMQSMDRMMRISREEALVSSHQTSKHLARGLAHEIKNPLGGIRGAAQLLAKVLPDPKYVEYTRVIIEEADRLRDLVDRMLGPQEPPVFTSVNIHEVLERVLVLLSVEAGGRVEFSRDYDPSMPELRGDRDQLLQAVLNVVRNAMQVLLDHPASSPCIRLRTRVQRYSTIGKRTHKLVCRLEVIDNGVGIPSEILSTIFYPMISGRANGTGLGLAISQTIIAQHQGLIECESQPGHTRFCIYLPLDV